MRTKKAVCTLVAAATLLSSLVGCSGSGTKTQTAASSSSATATKQYSGTITINTEAGTGAEEGWQAVADAYMKLQPNVKVVVDLKPSDSYGDWIQNMFNTSNPTADIVNINMASGTATDKAINFMDYANDTNPYTGKKWTDGFNFQMQSKDLAKNEWTSISLDSVQVLWCYNKDIFSKVGVEPPTTWDEFVTVCQKLYDAGYQPLAVSGNFNSFWSGQMGWLAQIYADQTTRSMVNVYKAQKGDYDYDEAMDGTWKYDASNPWNDDSWKVDENPVRAFAAIVNGTYKPDSTGMKTVWTNLAKVFPKYSGGSAFFGTDSNGEQSLFYQGKAAILLDGAWQLASFKRNMDLISSGKSVTINSKAVSGVTKFDLGTFNMPSMEGDGIEAKARSIEVAVGFIGAVKKSQEHNDMVADFLMYWSSKTGQSIEMSASLEAGGTPNGPSLVTGVELPAEYAKLFKNLSFVGNCQKGYGQMMARGAPGDVQASLRDWYNYSEKFLNGKITVDQWAADHKANVLKYLDDSLKSAKISRSDLKNPQNEPTGK